MSRHPPPLNPVPDPPPSTCDVLWFSDGGLKVGVSRLMAHPILGRRRSDDHDQLAARLTIAFRQRVPLHVLGHIIEAGDISFRGDHGLANIRLAMAGLGPVPAVGDLSQRLAMADTLLENGMTPRELLKALDLNAGDGLDKYDPNQPRVSEGSPGGGRWTSGDGGGDESSAGTAASGAVIAASPELAESAPLLAAGLGSATLTALATLAASIGFGAVFGTLFVPSPNDASSSGALPGDPGVTYDYNHDEGVLRVRDAEGNVIAAGPRDPAGIFFDAKTGAAFARDLHGALMFDAAAIDDASEREDAGTVTGIGARTDHDQPKLCPEPSPDNPGAMSASKDARDYQEQISAMINPQRPLKFGLAMMLRNPLTGAAVDYNECDEKTGTMIEAKGPRLAYLSGRPPMEKTSQTGGWLKLRARLMRQVVVASNGTSLKKRRRTERGSSLTR